MNILYVMQFFPVYGGGETVTVKLANELVKRNHNVYIAYTTDNYSDPMPYEVDNRIIKKKFRNLACKCLKSDIDDLHDYIVDNNINIVINQWADKRLCFKATRRTNAKLIKCYHISTFYPYIPTERGKRILRNIFPHLWDLYYHKKQLRAHKENLRYCDKYVFLTKYAVEELAQEHCFNESKVTAISNPATYNEYYDFSNLNKKKKIILYVGRMIEYNKRMSYMLAAWKIIADKGLLDDWKFVMIGEGPDKTMLLDKVRNENIPNVEFVGFCNPLDYYRQSAILLMSSYIEGFGMVILEGMQNGVVPIVTDSFSAAKFIIDNGENGMIVRNNDIELYAETIHMLMTNKRERERLALGAIKKSQKFDIRIIVNQWESLFYNLK